MLWTADQSAKTTQSFWASKLQVQFSLKLPDMAKTAWYGQNHAMAVFSSYLTLHIFWSPFGATQLQFQTTLHHHPCPSLYPSCLFAFSGIAACLTSKPLRVIKPITKCTVSSPRWSAQQLQFTSKFQELLMVANRLSLPCLKNTPTKLSGQSIIFPHSICLSYALSGFQHTQ